MEAGLATDQWKRSAEDYLSSAKALFRSMVEKGFDPKCPIPLDPHGELLNGSHRVACALALEIEEIPTVSIDRLAWAPPWGEAWFIANGMEPKDLERLRQDMARLNPAK